MKKLFPLFVLSLVMLGCDGPEGPTGAKGKDGNANVNGTIYNVPSSIWTNDGGSYSVSYNNQNITQDIEDNGAVLVYVASPSGWENLPYVFFEDGINAQYVATHQTGFITFYKYGGTGIRPPSESFKVVVIASSMLGKDSKDTNWKDYNEVKQKFNLQD